MWAPKLDLGKKHLHSLAFYKTMKYLPGKQIGKWPLSCRVSQCSTIFYLDYVFILIDKSI